MPRPDGTEMLLDSLGIWWKRPNAMSFSWLTDEASWPTIYAVGLSDLTGPIGYAQMKN